MTGKIDPKSLTWRVTPDLLGVLDASGYFTHTNPAWFATLGLKPEEIESRQFFEFIHQADIPKTERAFVEIQKGKPILNFENRYRHKDGSFRWLSWNAVPEDGIFFCSARDITDHKYNAATLKTREDEARLREQFVAIMGHDLRNPLAAVDAALRLLLRDPQTERGLGVIKEAQKSVLRMSYLIDNILDLAEARLGQGISINLKNDCDLRGVIQETVDEVRLSNPGIEIEASYSLDGEYSCDPTRLSQLVSNLLLNAVKHGDPDGAIKVNAEDRDGVFSIVVENAGNPIPKSALPFIFEPFTRLDKQNAPRGLGLGLFIAKQIALSHGGDLSVMSDKKKTVFKFQVPTDRVLSKDAVA